jgi:hypothetical protein
MRRRKRTGRRRSSARMSCTLCMGRVGSRLWQGTRYEGCPPPPSPEDNKNGGSADDGHRRRALVNGHSHHPSSFAAEAAVKGHEELK